MDADDKGALCELGPWMSTTRETISTCDDEITPMSMVTMCVTNDCHNQLEGMDFPNLIMILIEYEGNRSHSTTNFAFETFLRV